MITEPALERVEFTCGHCWHQWSTDYDIQHYRDDGSDWGYFSGDGIAVDFPYTLPARRRARSADATGSAGSCPADLSRHRQARLAHPASTSPRAIDPNGTAHHSSVHRPYPARAARPTGRRNNGGRVCLADVAHLRMIGPGEAEGDGAMTRLAVDGNALVLLEAVSTVVVRPDPRRALRGVRERGLRLPGLVCPGVWRHPGGRDFVSLRPHRNAAVCVELRAPSPFIRIVATTAYPQQTVVDLRTAESRAAMVHAGVRDEAKTGPADWQAGLRPVPAP